MQERVPRIVEEGLAAALQPIRQFVLAQALHHFLSMGVHQAIRRKGGSTVRELARDLGLHERRLRGFLQFLANENYVQIGDDDVIALTASGVEIAHFSPWYMLLVGGYAQSFLQMPSVLKVNGPYASRDASCVGVGSCGISQYDALPMTRHLLGKIDGRWRTIVDLGCGDGSYLIDLCRSMPGVRGLGFDPEASSVEAARAAAERYNISDRVEVRVGKATAIPDLSEEPGPLCFLTAFVLQEVLEQMGRDAVLDLMTTTFDRYPDSHWIVVEVDHRPRDPILSKTGLGLAYYNPYYLIHHLTEQRLESLDFWLEVYREAGLRVLEIERPEPSYDSLGLKVGFLLTRDL